jgi:uncharacterized membrane protein YidH (DUF202 family)
MPNRKKRPPNDSILPVRIILIVVGAVLLGLGWSAQSQGILWYTTRSMRTGTDSYTNTLSWIVIGVLLIIAGIFPWKWLSRRFKP